MLYRKSGFGVFEMMALMFFVLVLILSISGLVNAYQTHRTRAAVLNDCNALLFQLFSQVRGYDVGSLAVTNKIQLGRCELEVQPIENTNGEVEMLHIRVKPLRMVRPYEFDYPLDEWS